MRPLVAQISFNNLSHNFKLLKELHGNKILAVIKADAYGHGAIRCADALSNDADGFAVAFLEEALELRQAGIKHPIVLLEGVMDASEYAEIDQYQLWPVIHNHQQLAAFLDFSWSYPVTVWLKIDTGMRRVGFFPEEYAQIWARLKQSPYVKNIVKISHFSCADELNNPFTQQQIDLFDVATRMCEGASSLANSAGILAYPDSHRQWGRAGIALYGLSPFETIDKRLKPVMTLTTKVFSEKYLKKGESIGYGSIFTAAYDMRVGLIACGYADGYPRIPSTGNPVMIDGCLSRVIGRVSMDMMTVELNHASQGIGSAVELWGENILVTEIAQRNQTIPYEILCHLKRAHYQYK